MTWFSTIESDIYNYFEDFLTVVSDAPFPNLNITVSNQNDSVEGVAVFPTLYVHMLPPIETGNDLTNNEVFALNVTFELQVFSENNEEECRKILTECIQLMKKLHFNVGMFPDPQTVNKKYLAIARFNRVLAKGELDNLLAEIYK